MVTYLKEIGIYPNSKPKIRYMTTTNINILNIWKSVNKKMFVYNVTNKDTVYDSIGKELNDKICEGVFNCGIADYVDPIITKNDTIYTITVKWMGRLL